MHRRSFSHDLNMEPLEPRGQRRSAVDIDNNWPSTLQHRTVQESDELDFDRDSIDDMHRTANSDALSPMEQGDKPRAPSAGKVTWMSLPRKDQLFVLFIARFVDFLQLASLQAYVFYQLKNIDSDLTDAQVAQQAGLLQGCFTGAQVMTAILWGKAADASWCGRKWVLVIGLGGTAISCLGYGFATTFFWAAVWRAFGGAINGTVGIM